MLVLVLIVILVGCGIKMKVNKGEFFNYCQEIITNNSTIESLDISINSSGYFAIIFKMSDVANSKEEQYIDIYKKVSEYLQEINNGDTTFDDEQFKEHGIREIGIIIIYPNEQDNEVFAFYSNYYGGETIYSNNKLNVIDNFETWTGPD